MTQQKSFDANPKLWMTGNTVNTTRIISNDSTWTTTAWPSDLCRMMNALGDINGQKKPDRKAYDNDLVPIRIQKNGPAMIVFWRDGTKTIVRRGEDEPDSDYAAFTAALGIKVFGSNSKLKKIVSQTETQKPKKQKAEEQTETVIDRHDEPVTTEQTGQKSDAPGALQRVAEKFGMTVEEAFKKIKEAQKD